MSAKKQKSNVKPFGRGVPVTVTAPGKRPWRGIVGAVKYSKTVEWRVEVRKDSDGMTWSVPASFVRADKEKPNAKNAVPVRRANKGRANARVETALG